MVKSAIKVEFDKSVKADLIEFLGMLKGSLSLNFNKKLRVLKQLNSLSQFQVDALTKVFKDEKLKFIKLANEHQKDINILLNIAENNWTKLSLKVQLPTTLIVH